MRSDPKAELERILTEGVRKLSYVPIDFHVVLERPRNPGHGDFSSTAALQLAKVAGKPSRVVAEEILQVTRESIANSGLVEPPKILGPGFYNLQLKQNAKQRIVSEILQQGTQYGCAKDRKPDKVMVEFVSANPTGPLHVGHGRQAALGDAIAALLEAQGHAVTREFYYNDAGAQIRNLALSVQARAQGLEPEAPGWPAEGYRGEYIGEIARDFTAGGGRAEDLEAVRRFAVAALRKEQDADLQAFGVKFDVYSLESGLYTEGRVDAVVKALVASGKTFEQDGALWLRTTVLWWSVPCTLITLRNPRCHLPTW